MNLTQRKIIEKWPALIIITQIFVNVNDIKILPSISDDLKKGIITLTISKTIEKDPNIEEIEIIEDEDIKEENIKIVINFESYNFIFDGDFKIRNIDTGIKIIYLKIKEIKNEK